MEQRNPPPYAKLLNPNQPRSMTTEQEEQEVAYLKAWETLLDAGLEPEAYALRLKWEERNTNPEA